MTGKAITGTKLLVCLKPVDRNVECKTMQYDLNSDSVEIHAIETEMVQDVLSTAKTSAALPVTGTSSSDLDSVTISDEALSLASAIIPSIEEQEDNDSFNMLIAAQGGLVGPGGAMINIASTEEPVYAVVKNDSISISGTDIYSPQNAYELRKSTLRMLEYMQLMIQNVKIEEGHILQEKLMLMVSSLAEVQQELVGDPNYRRDAESLEEAFRNITSIMIADSARVEFSYVPDEDQMILEARSMADMFNNLLFESFTKYDAKKSFDKAWSALNSDE